MLWCGDAAARCLTADAGASCRKLDRVSLHKQAVAGEPLTQSCCARQQEKGLGSSRWCGRCGSAAVVACCCQTAAHSAWPLSNGTSCADYALGQVAKLGRKWAMTCSVLLEGEEQHVLHAANDRAAPATLSACKFIPTRFALLQHHPEAHIRSSLRGRARLPS